MGWENGMFRREFSWVSDAAANYDILADRMDSDTNDIVGGINNTLTRDGQNVPSGNLPMSGFKHLNVAVASSPTDYARFDQVVPATGAATITGTLAVTGALTAGGPVQINNTLGVTGAVTMTAALSVASGLTVGGAAGLNGNLTVAGSGTIAGGLTVTGGGHLSGGLAVTGDINASGNVVAAADLWGRSLHLTVDANISGGVSVGGNTTVNGGLVVANGLTFDNGHGTGGLTVDHAVVAGGNLSVGGTSTFAGQVVCNGLTHIGGPFEAVNTISFYDPGSGANWLSTSLGVPRITAIPGQLDALIVQGGAFVASNDGHINGDGYVAGNLVVGGTINGHPPLSALVSGLLPGETAMLRVGEDGGLAVQTIWIAAADELGRRFVYISDN